MALQVPVMVLLFLLCSAPGVRLHTASWRPEWPLQRVPVVLPQQTEERSTSTFMAPSGPEETSPGSWAPQDLLSYETLHSDGSLTETSVGVYGSEPGRPRTRRQVYGHDSRFSITGRDFLLRYPFSAAVKVSTGCSGTLVGERQVLTAAHCVHDGKGYVKGAHRLRVGFLKPRPRDPPPSNGSARAGPQDKMRFQWIRAKRTHVPKGWIRGTGSDAGMDYDYALLELKNAPKRRHMELGVSPQARLLPGRRVQFSGFDNDRPGHLVYRFCEVQEETDDLLYQRCDAQPGASGSGVYARLWNRRRGRWERKVIGVFSGHRWVDQNGALQEFNVAVRITPLKYAQICYWIKGDYMNCREG